MSLFARELARAGIRQHHPDWTEAEVSRELLSLTFLPAPLPAGLPCTAGEVFRRFTGVQMEIGDLESWSR